MKTLWLFDIDGTLININHLHLVAHRKSFEEVLSKKIPNDEDIIKYYGCTGLEFRKSVIKDLGLDCFDKIPEIDNHFNKYLIKEILKIKVNPLPGVKKFLDYLSDNKKNTIGIITGNREDTGMKVLQHAGLLSYFKVFGFDQGETRAEILKRTIGMVNYDRAIVMGDTKSDIKASRVNDCITVGVSTGSCSYEDLQKENPDLVLKSMEEYPRIINYIEKL